MQSPVDGILDFPRADVPHKLAPLWSGMDSEANHGCIKRFRLT